ncbi:MAG: hypothetical protein QOK05_2989 [Chloroflexota bacterium]|nr:hypothetical protein [Chloroflexota bacterium]
MRRLVTSLGATAAVVGALSLATPAFADYVLPGSGQNGTGNNLPASTADAPSPESPAVGLATLGGGVILVAVGGIALVDRRRKVPSV